MSRILPINSQTSSSGSLPRGRSTGISKIPPGLHLRSGRTGGSRAAGTSPPTLLGAAASPGYIRTHFRQQLTLPSLGRTPGDAAAQTVPTGERCRAPSHHPHGCLCRPPGPVSPARGPPVSVSLICKGQGMKKEGLEAGRSVCPSLWTWAAGLVFCVGWRQRELGPLPPPG